MLASTNKVLQLHLTDVAGQWSAPQVAAARLLDAPWNHTLRQRSAVGDEVDSIGCQHARRFSWQTLREVWKTQRNVCGPERRRTTARSTTSHKLVPCRRARATLRRKDHVHQQQAAEEFHEEKFVNKDSGRFWREPAVRVVEAPFVERTTSQHRSATGTACADMQAKRPGWGAT